MCTIGLNWIRVKTAPFLILLVVDFRTKGEREIVSICKVPEIKTRGTQHRAFIAILSFPRTLIEALKYTAARKFSRYL